jgi:hypothetical protein
MMRDSTKVQDAIETALVMARDIGRDRFGIVGYGIVELYGPDGELKLVNPFANLITDYGDLWYAGKGITSIPPANAAAPTALTGMQIGSGSTAVAKAGAGGAMVTLLAGQAFDATFPSTNNLGAGLGVEAVYKTTYAAATGTGTVNEATITNGTIGVASTAGNTIGRILTGAITKGAADSLAITWRHKFLGA